MPLLAAVAFGPACGLNRDYIERVVANAHILSDTLVERGAAIVSGGTDTHLTLVDLRPKGLTGDITEVSLEHAGITCNKNGIPFDPQPPMVTSGCSSRHTRWNNARIWCRRVYSDRPSDW